MRIQYILRFITVGFIASFISCNAQAPHPTSKEFGDYWYSGTAELCHFHTKQLRYGEIREGTAVMIFVTEDFNLQQHVKEEGGPSPESTKVLKTNFIEQFITGIYDYSIMSSVFTPIDIRIYPHSLKVTNSVQDWCGQTFTQLNAKDNYFQAQGFSYFQNKGDQEKELNQTWLEDEIWNRIRISPQSLPLGKCSVIPASKYFRLSHAEMKAYSAVATLTLEVTDKANREFFIYKLTYPELNRVLEIRFSGTFPYRIVRWEEHGDNGQLISSGDLTNWIKEPYWKLNGTEHRHYRDSLELNH